MKVSSEWTLEHVHALTTLTLKEHSTTLMRTMKDLRKQNRSKYMFMPAAGYFGRPTLASQQNLRIMLFCGDQGFYWTSNAGITDNKGAMAFTFQRNDVFSICRQRSFKIRCRRSFTKFHHLSCQFR